MKKIAFLFEGDIYNPRGEFIAIHNRLKNYPKKENYKIDAYVCWPKYDFLTAFILHSQNGRLVDFYEKDGINYNCVWYPKSLMDGITHKVFKRSTDFEYHSLLGLLDLKSYDLISAHSLKCARVAKYYKEKFGIPYVVTWHGSSIHSLPFTDKKWYVQTQDILNSAQHNFFVSEELQKIANRLSTNKSTISYNGIDTTLFYCYTLKEKEFAKKRLGFPTKGKIVAYVGNCFPIKNVGYLPYLFTHISRVIPDCLFCIVGNGPFKKLFEGKDLPIKYVGSINYTDMPIYYNVFDLVVLPSFNEGLPMTSLEATACGTCFIGSRVGEIENVVGKKFTIPLNSIFNETFANKCIEILKNNPNPPALKAVYNAASVVSNEIDIINKILDK